jgi:hypothetical protein
VLENGRAGRGFAQDRDLDCQDSSTGG